MQADDPAQKRPVLVALEREVGKVVESGSRCLDRREPSAMQSPSYPGGRLDVAQVWYVKLDVGVADELQHPGGVTSPEQKVDDDRRIDDGVA